jgi:hypothetical protein
MECECGCGQDAIKGLFKPGHDQKLRCALERRTNGIAGLRSLVDAAERFSLGESDSVALAETIHTVFKK